MQISLRRRRWIYSLPFSKLPDPTGFQSSCRQVLGAGGVGSTWLQRERERNANCGLRTRKPSEQKECKEKQVLRKVAEAKCDGGRLRQEDAREKVKLARRLASARLNTVRCGGGKAPFSHHNSSPATYAKHIIPSPHLLPTSGKKKSHSREQSEGTGGKQESKRNRKKMPR